MTGQDGGAVRNPPECPGGRLRPLNLVNADGKSECQKCGRSVCVTIGGVLRRHRSPRPQASLLVQVGWVEDGVPVESSAIRPVRPWPGEGWEAVYALRRASA